MFVSQTAIAAQSEQKPSGTKLSLSKAVMCEAVKNHAPKNQAVVFSITFGKVFCYTFFDHVPEKTFIVHNWFHIDRLNTKRKLSLNPPNWSTFSSIQLRETDKGPWRVEVTDQQGNTLNVLRLSITD